MAGQKPKAKKTPQARLQEFGDELLRRLFGLARGWEKHHDILKNNFTLGLKHLKEGYTTDAILRFKIVTWLDPRHAEGWYYLGCSYLAGGKRAQAAQALRKALLLKPGYEEAAYMYALAGGKAADIPPPVRMPLALVQEHFDAQAPGFSRRQVEEFGYCGHTLLCQALHACLMPGRIDHIIVELGVGTGLCGPLLRDVAAQLVGVDLSAPMLAEAMQLKDAQGKKIYDLLLKREVHECLQEASDASCDVILAAGLASYIGDLRALFQQAARVLRPGGIFAFTADKMNGRGFALDPAAARFRFSQDYLQALASESGLKALKFEEAATYAKSGDKAWLCIFAK